MIDTYTRLLEAVAETEDKEAADAAVSKLIHHLKASGRIQMLPQIARELRTVAARRHALRAYVEAASPEECTLALTEAAKFGIVADTAHVNTSLIAGWRARKGGKLIDRSAKHALTTIYQKVTA